MEMAAAALEVVGEVAIFLNHFKELRDPRQPGKVVYPLDEILLLCLLAVLAGSENFTEIALFGEKKLDLLRRFRPFANGTPPHDRLSEVFAALDANAFQRCFAAWVSAITGVPAEAIAIDGKTARRSYQKKGAKDPIHMVSAFAARQRLVLAQVKVAEKSNEIVAIPALLDLVDIQGAVITIDAMGCQRAIAQKIIDKKADYVLALKGNQSTLREDVELFAKEQADDGFKDTTVSRDQTVDGDHGRIETRTITVFHDAAWLQQRHNWPGLKSFVMVESVREFKGEGANPGKTEREIRFYVTSLALTAVYIAAFIRGHWAIENSLHWVMDMIFRDDECRIRKDHAPANFTTIKHMAYNLLRRAPGKHSMRVKRKVAAWDDDFLASLVGT
jgi:predicted transposase YbfD/YdcC